VPNAATKTGDPIEMSEKATDPSETRSQTASTHGHRAALWIQDLWPAPRPDSQLRISFRYPATRASVLQGPPSQTISGIANLPGDPRLSQMPLLSKTRAASRRSQIISRVVLKPRESGTDHVHLRPRRPLPKCLRLATATRGPHRSIRPLPMFGRTHTWKTNLQQRPLHSLGTNRRASPYRQMRQSWMRLSRPRSHPVPRKPSSFQCRLRARKPRVFLKDPRQTLGNRTLPKLSLK
jgi:hypothetical protein